VTAGEAVCGVRAASKLLEVTTMRLGPLQPYPPSEAISVAEASRRSCRAQWTIREWCPLHGIGRKIGGRWAISAPALATLLDGDQQALEAYLGGDLLNSRIRAYFERLSISSSCETAVAQEALF